MQDKSGASMRPRKWRLHVVFGGGMPKAMPPRAGPILRNLSISAAHTLEAAGFGVSLHISKGSGHGIAPDGLDFATAFLLATGAGTA